jgi:hypothetical protein
MTRLGQEPKRSSPADLGDGLLIPIGVLLLLAFISWRVAMAPGPAEPEPVPVVPLW